MVLVRENRRSVADQRYIANTSLYTRTKFNNEFDDKKKKRSTKHLIAFNSINDTLYILARIDASIKSAFLNRKITRRYREKKRRSLGK